VLIKSLFLNVFFFYVLGKMQLLDLLLFKRLACAYVSLLNIVDLSS
jgi:hypothetical protein